MHETCEACENSSATIVETCDDELQPYRLCQSCHHRLHALSLRPVEWYNLAKRHGWEKYLLHDDFYDEDGSAGQPQEDVVDAAALPAPILSDVSSNLESLLDFSITRWWFRPELAATWKKHAPDEVGQVLSRRFAANTNLCVRARILEVTAAAWGRSGAEFVRYAWGEYPAQVDLPALAEASAGCLPDGEGLDCVIAALGALEDRQKRDLMFALAYFRSPRVLDWIEDNVFEPITESWGYLAAASSLDWPRVARWLDSGRPLSLIAIDALLAIICPRTPLLRRFQPKLQGLPEMLTVKEALAQYRERDAVPRVQQRMDAVLSNLTELASEGEPASGADG